MFFHLAENRWVDLGSHLYDLPGLHGQRGEVSTAVDWDAFAEDGVQTQHLIPREHADSPTVVRSITGGHDDPTRRNVHRQRWKAQYVPRGAGDVRVEEVVGEEEGLLFCDKVSETS